MRSTVQVTAVERARQLHVWVARVVYSMLARLRALAVVAAAALCAVALNASAQASASSAPAPASTLTPVLQRISDESIYRDHQQYVRLQ